MYLGTIINPPRSSIPTYLSNWAYAHAWRLSARAIQAQEKLRAPARRRRARLYRHRSTDQKRRGRATSRRATL